jgi:hypothetical protein
MKRRTWFFLNAVVEIEPGRFHRAGFGRLLIPHPPVVNWLLRRGLPKESYKTLCAEHEMGHLQALPFEVLYSAMLVLVMLNNENESVVGWLWIIASSFSAWEIFAEVHTIRHVQPNYHHLYRDTSLVPRIIFWGISLSLMFGGWVYIVV